MKLYFEALSKYAEFNGRSRRREYWGFMLFNLLIYVGLMIVDAVLGWGGDTYGVLTSLYMLAVIIPGLAAAVRRLHDTGRSGNWVLISFVPFIGTIVLLFFLLQDSDFGENEYGPSPKPPAIATA